MCLMSGSARWECSLMISSPEDFSGVGESEYELTTSLGSGKSFSNITRSEKKN